MMRLALAIGHGPTIDKGAENKDGTTELDWNRHLAKLIVKEIRGAIPVLVINRVTERVAPWKEVNETKSDFAIELHLNSFNAKASGSEMIYWLPSTRGKKLAETLLQAAVGVLGLPDRGVKGPQGDGRGAPFLRNTTMPAVIVESFFIDAAEDLRIGNEKKVLLAMTYADALIRYAKTL